MIQAFHPGQWLTLHAAIVLLALLVYAGVSLATRQRRHPSAAVAWVISLVLIPEIAIPLFLLFGMRKKWQAPRRRSLAASPDTPMLLDEVARRFQALALALGARPVAVYGDLIVHEDGRIASQRLQEILLSARASIDVCTFLLADDDIGQTVTAVLTQRARDGVQVRLMIDGVGRWIARHPDFAALRAAGGQVRFFMRPLAWPLGMRVNLRNHRKMVVADEQRLWAGGRNLSDDYFGAGDNGWVDLSFDLHGPLAAQAAHQFQEDWVAGQLALPWTLPEAPAAPTPAVAATSGDRLAQVLCSGPDQPEDVTHSLLIEACFSARRRIMAVTPYFVPDPALLMAMTLAARRGVAVDLIVPRRSNHMLADLARPASLRELTLAGATVWLAPRMVHAKLVVIDESIALCGSLNLDQRSLFLNYELMVAFYAAADVRHYAAWAEALRLQAVRMPARKAGMVREFGEGLLRWVTFQL